VKKECREHSRERNHKRWLKSSARIAAHVANVKACLLHTNTLRPSKKPNGIMLKRASHPFIFEPISPTRDAKTSAFAMSEGREE